MFLCKNNFSKTPLQENERAKHLLLGLSVS